MERFPSYTPYNPSLYGGRQEPRSSVRASYFDSSTHPYYSTSVSRDQEGYEEQKQEYDPVSVMDNLSFEDKPGGEVDLEATTHRVM